MVDFTKTHELRAYIMETTGGPAAGGLTVRDVMATTAMGALLERNDGVPAFAIAEMAYEMADAMLEARITLPPKQETCTVEEAFGFPPPPILKEGGPDLHTQLEQSGRYWEKK